MKISDLMIEDSKQDIAVASFAAYLYQLIKDAVLNDAIPWVSAPLKSGEDPVSLLKGSMKLVFAHAGIDSKDDFKVEPPHWVTFDDLQMLIFYIIPDQPADKEGNVKGGGFGRNKKGVPVMVISGLLARNPRKYIDTRLDGMRRTIVHELTHYLDMLRSKNMNPSAERYDAGDIEGYYATPTEFNAYFQEAVDSMITLLTAAKVSEEMQIRVRSMVLGNGFDAFKRYFLSSMPKAYQKIFNKYQRKLTKRIYKLYRELVNRYEIVEGHDNATFFHPDIEPRNEFPLPTDAKKYKNVKSKRRGGAKLKVKTDPNSFENIT